MSNVARYFWFYFSSRIICLSIETWERELFSEEMEKEFYSEEDTTNVCGKQVMRDGTTCTWLDSFNLT